MDRFDQASLDRIPAVDRSAVAPGQKRLRIRRERDGVDGCGAANPGSHRALRGVEKRNAGAVAGGDGSAVGCERKRDGPVLGGKLTDQLAAAGVPNADALRAALGDDPPAVGSEGDR